MAGPIARRVVEKHGRRLPSAPPARCGVSCCGRSARRREKHKDPATRVFQALRIATNRELVELERFLDDAISRLALGARLTVLSYHSLEDRIVKRVFQRHTAGCTCPPSFPVCVCSRRRVMALVTKKPVRATLAELGENPRARSARLRIPRARRRGVRPAHDAALGTSMAYAVRRPVENVYLVRERDRRRSRELFALALRRGAADRRPLRRDLGERQDRRARLPARAASQRQREALLETKRRLEMDRAQAAALSRVEDVSRRTLGLVPPTLDQVVLVKDAALAPAPPPARPPAARREAP